MSNGTPPQKKSSPVKWIAIGCGAFVLIGACIAGSAALIAGGVFKATEAPAEAAHAFFGDLRAQNWQSAHSRMSAAYQSTRTPENLQLAAAQMPALTQQTDSTFSSRNIDATGATLSGYLTTPSGNVPVEVRLSSANDAWYIESLTVQGMTLH